MSFGLSANNDLGKLIIDGDTDQLYFVGKATYEGNSYNNNTSRTYTIACTGTPLVFIRSQAGWASVQSINNTGQFWRIVVACYSPTDLELYCFARVSSATAVGTMGIIVRSSSGSIVFDSRLKPLRLRGLSHAHYNGTVTHGVTGLSKPAAVLPTHIFQSFYANAYVINFYLAVFNVSPTEIVGGSVYAGYGNASVYPATGDILTGKTVPYVPIIDGADYD